MPPWAEPAIGVNRQKCALGPQVPTHLGFGRLAVLRFFTGLRPIAWPAEETCADARGPHTAQSDATVALKTQEAVSPNRRLFVPFHEQGRKFNCLYLRGRCLDHALRARIAHEVLHRIGNQRRVTKAPTRITLRQPDQVW